MDDSHNYESSKNTINEQSQYSDAYDDYEQVIKVNDKETSIINTNNNNNNVNNIKEEDNNNSDVNNNSIPIPEDNNDNHDNNGIKRIIYNTKTIEEVDEETNVKNNDSLHFDNSDSSINNSQSFKNNNNINPFNNKINDSFNINNKNNSININTNTNTNNSFNINMNNNNNNINNNNSFIISNKNNSFILNNNNNNINNSIKKDEDLYSIRFDSNLNSAKDSNDEEETNNKKRENSESFINKKLKNIAFDNNLQPLDNTLDEDNSNNNIIVNANTYQITENKPLKKISRDYKRFNTVNDTKKIKKSSFGKLNKDMRTNTNGNIDTQSTKKKKRPYFDLKNILKKAVVLNGKKGTTIKSSIFKSDNNGNNSFNDSKNSIMNEPYQIRNVNFNMKIDEINVNYLKEQLNLRRINVESKNQISKNNYFKILIELQNFYLDNCPVRVIKISRDGKYLAGGSKSGKIKVYEIIGYNYSKFKTSYKKKNIMKYLNFINETPYKTLERHKSDILDLSWSPHYPNLLLSSSFDHFVFLWDINQEENNCLLNEYEHGDIVTSISFSPNNKNIFISGCLDTFVSVWKFNYSDNIINTFDDNIQNNIQSEDNTINDNSNANVINSFTKNISIKKTKRTIIQENRQNDTFENNNKTNSYLTQENKDRIDYSNIENKITSLSFFPDGSKIGIGSEKGKIYVYNTYPQLNYNNNFFCSDKKFGMFHAGQKVTNIQFFDRIHAIISTSDSCIRLVDMSVGKILYKYKGYVNKNSMTRGFIDVCDDVIISGSEDGYCYVWNFFNNEEKIKKDKNKNYERCKPYSKELIECSLIVDERSYVNYMQKILVLTNKLLITSIIINGTSGGRLEVLLNIKEYR